MARSHARLLVDIWADDEFTALAPLEQRLYLFLISQPDLEHSGVIPLRERRWSRGSAGLDRADIERDLKGLEVARFVVIDEDTEELLVRSLMRRDGVWRQPNVAKSAAAQVRTVTSKTIRLALLEELKRIDVSEANDEVKTLHEGLIELLAKGSANPSGNPSPNPSEKGSELPQGKGELPNYVPKPPSPFPSPHTPEPSSTSLAPQTATKKTKRGTRIPEDFIVTADMVAWANEKTPHVDGRHETAKFINYWTAKSGKDATKVDWIATWRNWMLNAAERLPTHRTPLAQRNDFGSNDHMNRAMQRALAKEAAS